jgi:hypothetical protein
MIVALFFSFAKSHRKKESGSFFNWGKTPVPRATWPTPSPPWPDSSSRRYASARRLALFMVIPFVTGTSIIWMAQLPSQWAAVGEKSDEISLISAREQPQSEDTPDGAIDSL